MIIVFQTYKRTEYAIRSIRSVVDKLHAKWLIVDDGSDKVHLEQVLENIGLDNILNIYSHRVGYGRLANWAWQESAKYDPVTLWLEDDWTLEKAFDLMLYEKLLNSEPSIGMVRLARIPIGLHGEVMGDGSQVYLRLDKGAGQYYFSGNPSLRHSRFYDTYGPYPEGLEPGDTELAYDRQVQGCPGPDILIPFDVGTWGCFGHIGAEKSY